MHPVREFFPCTTLETAAVERTTVPSSARLDQGLAAGKWSGRGNVRYFARFA